MIDAIRTITRTFGLGFAVLIVTVLVLAGTARPVQAQLLSGGGDQNIVGTLQADDKYSTLVTLVETAGLGESLSSGNSSLTLFAPNNDAFAALDPATLDMLLNDTDALRTVLLYHVSQGARSASDLRGVTQVKTLEGGFIGIADGATGISANGTILGQIDINATNGIIHEVSTVLSKDSSPAPDFTAQAGTEGSDAQPTDDTASAQATDETATAQGATPTTGGDDSAVSNPATLPNTGVGTYALLLLSFVTASALIWSYKISGQVRTIAAYRSMTNY